MAYEWKDNDNFPKIKRDRLGFAEIGGIGQISYTEIKYVDYECYYEDKYSDGYNGWMIEPMEHEKPIIDTRTNYTGEELLASICNLAKRYNTQPSINNPAGNYQMIIDWCKDNVHPYDIDTLYEAYRPLLKNETRTEYESEFDGVFKLNDFLRDMENVYNVYMFYFAYIELLDGRPEMAFNLYKQGYYFDTYPFFEEYKIKDWKPYKESAIEKIDTHVDIVEEMMKDSDVEVELLTIKDIDIFKKNVIRDKKRIYQLICDMIPEIKMVLKYDQRSSKTVFTANVNSIFDICWYTISRMVAANSPSPDEYMGTAREYWSKTYLSVCVNCGEFFARKSNRQLYCDSDECKKACNRNRQKEFQRRKKEKIDIND